MEKQNSEKRNRIIFYSGGKSSFTVAHLVKERYPNDNIVLYFTDTLWEDEDLYRFIFEGADKLELPLLIHSKRQTPIELMYESKIVFSSRLGLCSQILKMKVSSDFIREGIKPEYEQWYNKDKLLDADFTNNPVLYFGISWDEAHREADIRKNWAPYDVEMPLMEEVIDNSEILLLHNIKEPRLYEHGFAHNNCFSGKEKFITDRGLKTFKETVGTKVKVLGERGSWQDAEIKSFGEQELMELTISDGEVTKVIEVTSNHRWFKIREKELLEVPTSKLKEGDKIPSNYEGQAQYSSCWKVVSIKEANKKEEVYCAVVPKGNAFTLEDNIYTGNCMARCVKAGQGHYLILLEQMPDVFYSIMMEELQISTYVSSYHYLRKPKYHDRHAWLTEEEIQTKLVELDDAYREWALGNLENPKPWTHPCILAPEKIECPEGINIDYVFEYFTDGRSGKSKWRKVEHKVKSVDKKGKVSRKKPKKPWKMKSSKYRTIETRHKTPIKYSFMKKSKNGITFPYMIYDLFNDHTTNPESIDRFDIGGCACFIDYNLEGKTKEEIQEMELE